jgi:hypothetical protein
LLPLLAACGIGLGAPASAIPPPYVPPPAPEIVAAADALAAQIPIEQWVSAAIELQSNGDSRLGWAVTSALVDNYVERPPHGVSRPELKLLLYHRIARRLPGFAPSVVAELRALVSGRFQGTFSQVQLLAWRAALESDAGRGTLQALLAADLLNGLLARDVFMERILPERDALVRAALADHRAAHAH